MTEEEQIALAIQMSMNEANEDSSSQTSAAETPSAMETEVRKKFIYHLSVITAHMLILR